MIAHFKVRLLNGPLAGSEVQLPDGEWRIGGSNSDFAVNLEHDAQAVLRVDVEGVQLEGDAPYWINGRRGRYPAERLPLQTPVEIAGIGIVLAAVDAEIHPVRVPSRRSATSRALAVCLAAGMVAVLMLLLSGAILVLPPNFRPPPSDVDVTVARLASTLRPQGIYVAYKGNVVTLRGACTVRSQVEAARQELVRKGVAVVDDVICEDDLVRSVTGVLELYGIQGVKVYPDTTPGHVTFAGHVASDAKWANVARVLSNTPGLVGWRISDPEIGASAELSNQLRAAQLLDHLSVFRAGEIVLVSGEFDAVHRQELDAILAAFRRTHPNGPRVVYQDIPPYLPLNEIFPSPLVAIGGNSDQPFAVLQNGDRLEIGDVLPSGYEITAIHLDGVDVERSGDFVHAPVRTILR